MELGRYTRSPVVGERASERQRGLAVNQSCLRALRRFESCRSHKRIHDGELIVPSTPNWLGTGLLNRSELVRFQPAATNDIGGCKL